VHYLSGARVIFDVKEYAGTLTGIIKKKNIQTHFGVNVTEINAAAKRVYYDEKNKDGITERKEMKFDMCHGVPVMPAPYLQNMAS
jgi:sulfide:quinone oxidoreductase